MTQPNETTILRSARERLHGWQAVIERAERGARGSRASPLGERLQEVRDRRAAAANAVFHLQRLEESWRRARRAVELCFAELETAWAGIPARLRDGTAASASAQS